MSDMALIKNATLSVVEKLQTGDVFSIQEDGKSRAVLLYKSHDKQQGTLTLDILFIDGDDKGQTMTVAWRRDRAAWVYA